MTTENTPKALIAFCSQTGATAVLTTSQPGELVAEASNLGGVPKQITLTFGEASALTFFRTGQETRGAGRRTEVVRWTYTALGGAVALTVFND